VCNKWKRRIADGKETATKQRFYRQLREASEGHRALTLRRMTNGVPALFDSEMIAVFVKLIQPSVPRASTLV